MCFIIRYLNSTTNLGVICHHICISYKAFFFGVPVKCAGVGVAKFSKNAHVRCEKLLCAECVGVPKLAAHKYSVNIISKLNIIVSLNTFSNMKKNRIVETPDDLPKLAPISNHKSEINCVSPNVGQQNGLGLNSTSNKQTSEFKSECNGATSVTIEETIVIGHNNEDFIEIQPDQVS